MKRLCKNIFAAVAALAIAAGMTGCAHDHHDRDHHHHGHDRPPGMGAAPAGVTGSAQGGTSRELIPGRSGFKDPLQTESVMPGVGSALFPNPEGP